MKWLRVSRLDRYFLECGRCGVFRRRILIEEQEQ
jgi:hypothetical protein